MTESVLDKIRNKYVAASVDHLVVETIVEPPQAVSGDLPASVMELGALLAKHPVRIVSTIERTGIEWRPGWNGNPIWRRVSDLVFFDRHCFAYVSLHPARVIDGKNFFQDKSQS